MVRQFLALVEHEIGLLVERDLVAAEQAELFLGADALETRRDRVGIDPVRPFAFEAAQDRLVGAVSAAGQGERAEELATHALDAIQDAGLGKPALAESHRRAHRPDGMRGRRPDADLEEVENADGHKYEMGA